MRRNKAKEQRGETTLLSKAEISEKEMDNFSLGLESSDDEAPEEVTFEDSRAQALQSVKQALERARR